MRRLSGKSPGILDHPYLLAVTARITPAGVWHRSRYGVFPSGGTLTAHLPWDNRDKCSKLVGP